MNEIISDQIKRHHVNIGINITVKTNKDQA